MKNIIIKIWIALSILSFIGINYIWNTYANSDIDWIKVIVTEKIPGANCKPTTKSVSLTKKTDSSIEQATTYTCIVWKGFSSVITMMWKIIKYFTYIASLGWVLFIVINGILYSMWWADPSIKDEAKKRIIATIIWLVLLFLSWVILNLIAPWIYN